MIGGRTAFVAATLGLPVLALGGLIAEQEIAYANMPVLNVPLTGVDPRDLLRGHYIMGQLDWDWASLPATGKSSPPVDGGLCILPGENAKPRVRFLEVWTPESGMPEGCRLMLAGQVAQFEGRPPRFAPRTLDRGEGSLELFVPETRASELEETIRRRPGAVTVDLVVRPDGSAQVRAIRVDGRPLGR